LHFPNLECSAFVVIVTDMGASSVGAGAPYHRTLHWSPLPPKFQPWRKRRKKKMRRRKEMKRE
jgi:hypothetical protein